MSVRTVVFFFSNGNTAVCQHGEQVPHLQQPWLLRFVDFLRQHGVDPLNVEINMPNGNRAVLFERPDGAGLSWRMEEVDPAETLREVIAEVRERKERS